MQNISNVTNHVPGQDINTNRPAVTPNDTQIQNIPDPSRVTRPDQRTDRQDNNLSNATRRYDSYFQAFLSVLRDSGSVSQTMSQLLSTRPGILVTSGMSDGISEEMAKLMKMLNLNESELAALVRGQLSTSTRFGNDLFESLRNILKQNPSESLKADILQFLKNYNDFSSTPHIENNLKRAISQMTWFMPERFSTPLNDQLNQLKGFLSEGNRAAALKLLQNGIIPYMSDYVSKMHERGITRNLLSMLILDIARYQNGSPQELLRSFYQLLGYQSIKKELGDLSPKDVLALLQKCASEANSAPSPLPDLLAEITSRSLTGETSPEIRQGLQALVDSILINQSVYMPLAHALIPVEMNGKMMFSEIWVDPDSNPSPRGKAERICRVLIKFDIQELGFFDLILTCQGDNVDISLNCPPHLIEFEKTIADSISSLAAKDGLKANTPIISPMIRPLTITEVFPKIFERKDSINVTI